MTDKKVWFVTGAGRGMGVDIAQAALAAGYAVVATGRNTDAVADAVGDAHDLLVVQLDVTSLASAEAAVQTAVERFGRIDVLVNNAGNFYAGFFEELSPEQMERQLDHEPCRAHERRSRSPACHAQAAVGERRHDHVDRRHRWARVLLGLRCLQVRARRLDGVAAVRGRTVRHPHDHRGAGVLPHRRCSRRSQRPTPSCRSTTMPSAPPRRAPLGKR